MTKKKEIPSKLLGQDIKILYSFPVLKNKM